MHETVRSKGTALGSGLRPARSQSSLERPQSALPAPAGRSSRPRGFPASGVQRGGVRTTLPGGPRAPGMGRGGGGVGRLGRSRLQSPGAGVEAQFPQRRRSVA